MSSTPQVGQPAPEFTLPSTADGDLSLASLRGKKVAILFYVFDFTPG